MISCAYVLTHSPVFLNMVPPIILRSLSSTALSLDRQILREAVSAPPTIAAVLRRDVQVRRITNVPGYL